MKLLQGAPGETDSSWSIGGLDWMKIFCKLCWDCQALAQSSGGVTIPVNVEKTWLWHGGHGLVLDVLVLLLDGWA